MTTDQPTHRSRIPKIAAVACSLVLVAGYVHYSATGQWLPGIPGRPGLGEESTQQSPSISTTTAQVEATQAGGAPVLPDSKRGAVFSGSKSRVLINPHEEHTKFFGGSKSVVAFDPSDMTEQAEPAASQPKTAEE